MYKRQVDDISGKLDLVINMLAAAGIGSTEINGGRLSYTDGMGGMGGVGGILPRQTPYTADASGNGASSQEEIDGWLGTVQAGQKRDRNSSTQGTNSVRKVPKQDGKKFISSEGSMSSGESEPGKNGGKKSVCFTIPLRGSE